MRKKIFLNLAMITVAVLLIFSLLLCLVLYLSFPDTYPAMLNKVAQATVFAVAAAIIICFIISRWLTKKLIKPISDFSFDDPIETPYEEFVPLVRAIKKQRNTIESSMVELQERSRTINSIVEKMKEGAVLLNPDGTILSVNRSALQLFDANGDITGRDIRELFRDIKLLEYTEKALSGTGGEMAIERLGRDYLVSFSPVSGSGAILLFIDTTERTKLEKLRREFSANVSHELKTPLTSISGYAEMLGDGLVKDDDKEAFLIKIRDEARRLIYLVKDIMYISRLDEGIWDESYEATEVNLAGIIGEVASSLESRAREAGVSIILDTGSDEEFTLHTSRSMMDELFRNLMDNAIKYNKKGGSVTVKLEYQDDHIIASVSDTGIGIPENEKGRVFERFFRVDKSRSKSTGGTGLGLAIVKHVAMTVGAEISLESELGEGTEIKIKFSDKV